MAKFKAGESGNPAGRPKGQSQAARLRDAIANDVPAIISAIVKKAKEGDVAAAKLLLDRSIPAIKPKQEAFKIGGISNKSLSAQGQAIVKALLNGQVTAEQANDSLSALVNFNKIREFDEFERRLSALEEKAHADD